MNSTVNKSPAKSSITMKLLPIVLSMTIWTGCAHYKVLPSDKTLHRLKAGQPWTPSVDGWFVPDARWLELRQALADKIESLEPTK